VKVPIAIVGGGPVGLMLALFLDRHGVKSTIFNIEDTTRMHPKGNTHNSRTVEHYRRLGLSERIRDLGLPLDHPTDVAFFTGYNAWELARLRMPSEAEKRAAVASSSKTEQVIEPILRVNQMYVERVLFDHARTRPNITMRFGWEVKSFEDRGTEVLVHAEKCQGGSAEDWTAQYMVGCDGGSGFVRKTLGIHYAGESTLDQQMIGGAMFSSYVRAPGILRDALGQRRAWTYRVVREGFQFNLISLNGRDEFNLSRKAEDPSKPPDDAQLVRVIHQAAGFETPVEVIGHRAWHAGYALCAERFGAGRVVLCGDSVHLFTPTGGFGMNTGVDDAANLSWKLAALVQGWGGPGLLDTYEIERKPIGQRNTMAAHALAKPFGGIKLTKALEIDAPEGEVARREVGAYLSTFAEEFASIGVQLGARYDGSPIVIGDGTPPADDYINYVPSAVPGGRAPHVWVDEGRGRGSSLFDRLGVGFTLLRLGPRAPSVDALTTAAKQRGIPLAVLDLPDTITRSLYGRDLAIVRPDQHIAWRANAVPADASGLWARLTGG
jgi:2-polyprenyl-6-methoxyphenol hydroxylase-like FAD-dependent oxidoreductase